MIKFIFILFVFFYINNSSNALENFLFIGGDNIEKHKNKINDKTDGVQIIYFWKDLEIEKDIYDFSKIEEDLKFLYSINKKLWIQIQDRSFSLNNKVVPKYILTKEYDNGIALQEDNPGESKNKGHGWIAKQWNKNTRLRYQKLLYELAKKFDGKIYGINLPETAIDIDIKKEKRKEFSCNKYFNAEMENINFIKSVFKESYVVQYINFWPCEWDNDHKYMSRFFENAIKNKIGLGGPDIVPYKKGQMKNSYPFFNKYKERLSIVAMAIQEPTRTYTNPKTGKKFTDEEFKNFAIDYLGVNIIFWS